MGKANIKADVKDFELVLTGLRRIDPTITVKGLTLDQMEQLLQRMSELDRQALDLDQGGSQVQGQREKLAEEYHELCKQARAKVKGDLGDDAPELELIGVVRSSQIVRTRRGKNKKSATGTTDSTGSP